MVLYEVLSIAKADEGVVGCEAKVEKSKPDGCDGHKGKYPRSFGLTPESKGEIWVYRGRCGVAEGSVRHRGTSIATGKAQEWAAEGLRGSLRLLGVLLLLWDLYGTCWFRYPEA